MASQTESVPEVTSPEEVTSTKFDMFKWKADYSNNDTVETTMECLKNLQEKLSNEVKFVTGYYTAIGDIPQVDFMFNNCIGGLKSQVEELTVGKDNREMKNNIFGIFRGYTDDNSDSPTHKGITFIAMVSGESGELIKQLMTSYFGGSFTWGAPFDFSDSTTHEKYYERVMGYVNNDGVIDGRYHLFGSNVFKP